jgi:hypothetical protein
MNTGAVVVEGAQEFRGVRVDHPRILEGVRNLLKQGYNNEHICKVIGVPQEVVDKERARLKKLKE